MSDSISVVMAVYNGRRFLPAQLQSIMEQLLPEDELVIVDDASTDDSVAFLRNLESPQIRLFTNLSNGGVMKTFERGLTLSNNDLVFLCDQDDLWLPGKRAAFVAVFQRDPGVTVVVSDAEIIDREDQIIERSFMATRGGFHGSVLDTLWRNRYLGCAMALRRSLLDAALPLPPQIPMHDMWFGILGRVTGRIAYLPTPYTRYRRHDVNATPSRSRFILRHILRWRVSLLVALVQRLLAIKFGLHKSIEAPGTADHAD